VLVLVPSSVEDSLPVDVSEVEAPSVDPVVSVLAVVVSGPLDSVPDSVVVPDESVVPLADVVGSGGGAVPRLPRSSSPHPTSPIHATTTSRCVRRRARIT